MNKEIVELWQLGIGQLNYITLQRALFISVSNNKSPPEKQHVEETISKLNYKKWCGNEDLATLVGLCEQNEIASQVTLIAFK